MHATCQPIRKIALLAIGAGLIAGLAQSQTLLVNGLSSTSVTLFSNNPAVLSVTSSDGTAAIPFSIQTTGGFFSASADNNATTASNLTLKDTSTICATAPGGCAGTVTLTDTRPGHNSDTATITVGYSSSPGGGGGSGSVTVSSPGGITINALPGTDQAQFQVSTTSTSPISFSLSVTYATGSGWLLAPNPTSTTTVSGNPATVTVNGNPTGLSNGIYSGSVVVTPTGQAAITVPVTLIIGGTGTTGTLAVAPSTVALSYTSGTGIFPSQAVTLTSSTGATTFSATVSSNAPWLLVNGQSTGTGAISSGLTVSAGVAAPTVPGTYAGYVTVTASDGSIAQINVTLTVNGGTVSGVVVLPQSLTFSTTVGSTSIAPAQISVSVPGGSLTSSTVTNGSPWLAVSQNTTTSPATLTVTANPTGLTAGTYIDSITINTNIGGTAHSQVVAVTLFVVGASTGITSFSVAPSSLSFTANINQTTTTNQYLLVSGGASFTVSTSNFNPPSSSSWLNVQTGVNQIAVSATPIALPPGVYSATISVTAGGNTQNVAVTLTVTGSPVILAQPGSLVFNYTTGGANPTSYVFLTSSDSSAFSITSASPTATWLSASISGTTVGITANPTGLAAGLYTAGVTLYISSTTSSYANVPLSIPVALLVNGGASTGPLTFSPSTLSFTAQPNSAPFGAQINVYASSATLFTVSCSPACGTSWLTVNQGTGVSPTAIAVSINPAGLPVGTTTGALYFTANGISQTVNVSVVVGGGNLSVSSTTLSLSAPAGGSATSPQPVTVSSTAGQTPFTVATSAAWLKLDKNTATTQATVNITADPTGLAAGTYTGTVTFTPTAGGTAATVNVTFTVVAAPTIAASSGTLTFHYQAGDTTLPAAQNVTITGGAWTAAASSTGNWLVASPASGSSGSPVAISVNPAGLAVGSYTGTVTISGSGGATGTATINVTLTITPPLPTITNVINAASGNSTAIAPGEIITIFGTSIGPATPITSAQLDSTGKLATTLGGVQVLINGFAAPMANASATQVSAIVPYELAPFQSASIVVKYQNQSSNGISLPVTTTVPGIFTQNQQGSGPGAFNADFSLNGPNNPTTKGGYAVLYLTGEGQTNPLGVTGTINSLNQKAPTPLLPVTVTLDGQPLPSANVVYAGGVPGIVEGLMQLNIQIPVTARSGDLPIVVTIGNNSSQTGVTLSVK